MARASLGFAVGVGRYVAVTYPREVYATRGRSVLLKPAEPETAEPRWFGLLTKPLPEAKPKWFFLRNPVTPVMQAIPRRLSGGYHFTPLQAFHRNAVDLPTRALTKRLFGKEMKWTIPVYLLASVAVGMLAEPSLEELREWMKEKAFKRAFEQRAPEWDAIIEGDYRYDDLREALENGELPPQTARFEAMARNHGLHAYFRYLAQNPDAAFDEFAEDPHFADIAWLRENGVPDHPGLRPLAHFSQKLSPAQIEELAGHMHKYLHVSEAIWLWINEEGAYRAMTEKNPALAELLTTIEREPFHQKLMALEKQGRISSRARGRLLQEDAYWQRTFAEWRTLGVEKRKKQNGKYLDVALTLEDIRQETLDEIP